MFEMSAEALRAIREQELQQTEDELGARLFRIPGGGDLIREYEAGATQIPGPIALGIIGLREASKSTPRHAPSAALSAA